MNQRIVDALFFLQSFAFHYRWQAHLFSLVVLHRQAPDIVPRHEVDEAFQEMAIVLDENPIPALAAAIAQVSAWIVMPLIAPFGRVL